MISTDDGRILWRGDGETLIVEAWGPDSARVRAVPGGDPIDHDHALLPPTPCDATVTCQDGAAVLSNGSLRVIARTEDVLNESLQRVVHRCRLSFTDAEGRILFEELPASGALNLRARDYRMQPGGGFELTASFISDPHEHLAGMGEYQQPVADLKGATLDLEQRNSQASVPFLLSSAGYGFLWHNPAVGRVDLATNRTVWTARSTDQLDYWVTPGGTPAQMLAHYADATGHAPALPGWAQGFWQCKLRYWNQEQLLEVAREFARRDLPLDVIVADFFHWPHMGDYRFEEEFWPDPDAMVAELKELGVELMVSVWPQVALESENFEEMASRNLLVRTDSGMDAQMAFQGPSMFVDVTNPEARDFLWRTCRRNYFSHGIRMFWLDEAEPEFGRYDYRNYRYHAGPAEQVSNRYPQLYARTFFEGQRAEGQEEIANLVRCAWAGSQRYGVVVWSGDIHSTWADLANQIPIGIHLGAAGIPWFTTDTGGFAGADIGDPAFHELLVRWFQFATFCPVMRLHGDRMPFEEVTAADGTPRLRSGAPNEPWTFGGRTGEIIETCIRARERLRPVIARAGDQARTAGLPMMRGLFLEFPDDAESWTCSDEFLLGAGLLVCPVLEPGADHRRVWLPSGAVWTDLRGGARYDGGQWLNVRIDLSSIPVYGRDAAADELIDVLA